MRDLGNERLADHNVSLEIHSVQQDPHPVHVRHFAFKHAAQVLETSFFDYNFIAGFKFFKCFPKTITSYSFTGPGARPRR